MAKLFEAKSPEAEALRDFFSGYCNNVAMFGHDIWQVLLARLNRDQIQVVQVGVTPPEVPSAVFLGFHLKALDILLAATDVAKGGSIGCLLILCRTLFETTLNLKYIEAKDTAARLAAFCAHTIVRTYSLGRPVATATTAYANRQGVSADPSSYTTHWAKPVHMAKELGLQYLYEDFYRVSSAAAHGLDVADVYNPASHWNWRARLPQTADDQPDRLFSNYACLALTEIVGTLSLLGVFALIIFGATAKRFVVPLSQEQQASIEWAQQYLNRDKVTVDEAQWRTHTNKLRDVAMRLASQTDGEPE